MTDKKLSRSMEILEVVIQMITFYSAFMAVYFGALQKPVSQLWKSLIIFVFVAAAYYSRRKIKLFKPFIVLHIAIIAAAFFMGTTDAERFSYFLIAALIAGYSIRLKTIALQKNDLSNTPYPMMPTDWIWRNSLKSKKIWWQANRFRCRFVHL